MLDYEFFYIISIPIYIILLLWFIFKRFHFKKIFIISIFYFYLISLLAVTLFPIPIQWLQDIWIYYEWNKNNFLPLSSIGNILWNEYLSLFQKMKQVLWNIIIFIPLWFFIPFFWKSKNSFQKIIYIGVLCSISIELLQYFIWFSIGIHYKITDVDDIILNTIGFIIWLYLYKYADFK
jgi:glycopeptide antibiotics resistance protein